MAADFVDEDFITEDANDYDIIIIGAGLAGLTCAYNILKKGIGLDVLIIEANNEIGGRVLSNNFSDTYHANFLQKHVTDLVKKLDLKVDQRSNAKTRRKILYAKRKSLRSLPKFYGAEVHHFLRTIEKIVSNPTFSTYVEDAKDFAESSVEQFLRQIVYFPRARSLCRTFICSTCAIRNLRNISLLWFLVMLHGASGLLNRLKITTGDSNRYFIHGGMIKITRELLKSILRQQGEIRYTEPVSKISFNDYRAYVSTGKNHFRCEFVVLATPPSTQNHIIIEPSRCVISNETLYTPGENVFFNVVYERSMWSENSLKDILTTWDSNNNLNIIYDATHGDQEKVVLAGFLDEPDLVQTQKQGLFDTLRDCYKTDNSLKYLRYKEYDQSLIDDEVKVGCPMSAMKPTSIDNHINCTGKSHGRIFFASSEYATNWPGTIDGAIQAGESTAYAILLRIRPQALTFQEMSKIGSTDTGVKASRRDPPVPFKICILQYLGIFLNVAVFLSFLKVAYD